MSGAAPACGRKFPLWSETCTISPGTPSWTCAGGTKDTGTLQKVWGGEMWELKQEFPAQTPLKQLLLPGQHPNTHQVFSKALKWFRRYTTKGITDSIRDSISPLPKFTQPKARAANNKDRWRRNTLSLGSSTAHRHFPGRFQHHVGGAAAAPCHPRREEQPVSTLLSHLSSVTVGNSLRKAFCTKQTQDRPDNCQHRMKSWRKAEFWGSSSFPHQRCEWPTQADFKIPQACIKKKQQRFRTNIQNRCLN